MLCDLRINNHIYDDLHKVEPIISNSCNILKPNQGIIFSSKAKKLKKVFMRFSAFLLLLQMKNATGEIFFPEIAWLDNVNDIIISFFYFHIKNGWN